MNLFRFFFRRPLPPPGEYAGLFDVEATERLLHWLTTQPDTDKILQKAGISRTSLRAVAADDEVSQALDTRRDAVLATPWRIEPDQGRAAKQLKTTLDPWIGRLVSGAFSATPYGYSVIEVVYRDGPRVVIDDLQEKPFEWFRHSQLGGWESRGNDLEFNPDLLDGTWRYFSDDGTAGAEGRPCDPRKFFVTVRQGSYYQPYGESLLSRLYWPILFRREGWSMWVRFLERFATPILTGQVQNPQDFVAKMQQAGIETAFGVGAEEKITAAVSAHPGEFEKLEHAIIRRVQRLILGQTASSGDAGGFSQGQQQENVRTDKRNADIRMITGTAQRIVDVLTELNGWPAHKFVMADDTGLEADRAERDAKLLPVLEASKLKLTREYFTDRYDLTDEDLMDAPEPPVTPPPLPGQQEQGTAFPTMRWQFARKPTEAQAEVDRIIEAALAAVPEHPLDPTKLRAAIDASSNEAELYENLAVFIDPDSDEFAQALERAAFAASVLGVVSASEGRT